MATLYEEEIKSKKTEFDMNEVLEIAKTHKLASFAEYDKKALETGNWFWTGTWIEIKDGTAKAWHINDPKTVKECKLPESGSWCILDEFGLPVKESKEEGKSARRFWWNEGYKGLLRRDDVVRRGVVADWGSTGSLRVLIE